MTRHSRGASVVATSQSDDNKENESRDDSWKNRRGVPPLYIEYAYLKNRLSTFNDQYRSKSKSSHSCEELAAGGFFYSGYEDCVRCFYCGLGLRSWRAGDDMHVEHKRHRPNCRFLEVITSSKNKVDFELLMRDSIVDTDSKTLSTRDKAALLQEENKNLKERHLCRMCFRNQARELLLPCSELIICLECSDITSTCPSCRKEISATVSVFLV